MKKTMSMFVLCAAMSGFGLAGAGEGLLPAEYEQLGGVRATKGQIITTGYVPKQSSVYNFSFSLDGASLRWRGVFGNFKGENDNATRLIRYDADDTSFLCNNLSKASGGGSKAAGVNSAAGQRVVGVMDSTRCVLTGGTGTPVEANVNLSTGNANNTPLRLLGASSNEGGSGVVEMYSFRIEEKDAEGLTNIVVRNYIPSRRKADGAVGFFDVVGEEGFLTPPAGTTPLEAIELVRVSFKSAVASEHELNVPFGSTITDSVASFVKVDGVNYECLGYTIFVTSVDGRLKEYASGDKKSFSVTLPMEVTKVQVLWRYIPASYGLVEYLKSSGPEYVNTEYTTKQGTEFLFKYAMQTGAGHPYAAAFGTYNGETENCTRIIADYETTTKVLVNFMNKACDCGQTTLSPTAESMDVVEGSLSARGAVLNGKSKANHTSKADSPDERPIILFRANPTSTGSNAVQFWYMQIFEDGFLVHSYLPCTTPAKEGVMFDLVSGKPFENKGGGAFICGPKIKRPKGLVILIK